MTTINIGQIIYHTNKGLQVKGSVSPAQPQGTQIAMTVQTVNSVWNAWDTIRGGSTQVMGVVDATGVLWDTGTYPAPPEMDGKTSTNFRATLGTTVKPFTVLGDSVAPTVNGASGTKVARGDGSGDDWTITGSVTQDCMAAVQQTAVILNTDALDVANAYCDSSGNFTIHWFNPTTGKYTGTATVNALDWYGQQGSNVAVTPNIT